MISEKQLKTKIEELEKAKDSLENDLDYTTEDTTYVIMLKETLESVKYTTKNIRIRFDR